MALSTGWKAGKAATLAHRKWYRITGSINHYPGGLGLGRMAFRRQQVLAEKVRMFSGLT